MVGVGGGGCVGAGVCVGAGGWVGASVGGTVGGTVVAVGTTVGGAVVAVGTGFVAVGEATPAGFGVAVGEAALFAVLDEGFLVAVGAGEVPACEELPARLVAVGVGDARGCAAFGESELSPASWSSGAAGGGFKAPVVEGGRLPLRSAATVGVSGAALPPPKTPAATRPPEMVRVPPAINARAIALGVMTGPPGPALPRVPWRPRPCSEPKGVVSSRTALPWTAYQGSLLLVIVQISHDLTVQTCHLHHSFIRRRYLLSLGAMQGAPDTNRGLVAGADGCPGGWVCVTARAEESGRLTLAEVAVVADFAALLRKTRACEALAVDIPIGLSEDGRREADFEARRRIGPRRSSVFPPPPRFVLDAPDYEAANSASKSRYRRGLQKQTFNILPKIREADAAMTPAMQDCVVESHPEVCFWALAGERHLMHAKRTREGRAERLRLLETVYGEAVRDVTPPRGAARDDLYDACVLAWTASHVAAGTAVHLPGRPQRDERGLRMEIVY